jgi:pilus assembly protein Flp/PilA
MWQVLTNAMRHEGGATAIEFALVGVLVAVAIVAGASTLGNSMADTFHDAASDVTEAKEVWQSD